MLVLALWQLERAFNDVAIMSRAIPRTSLRMRHPA